MTRPAADTLLAPGRGIVALDGAGDGASDPLLATAAEADLRRHFGDGVRGIGELARGADAAERLRRATFDRRRGSWRVLVPVGESSVVADLDSGFGAVTRALAEDAGLVVGVDDVRARLVVSDEVNGATGVANVRLAHGGPAAVADWPDACLDGVWLGRRADALDGAAAEWRRELRRTLRPEGWLAMGFRNGPAVGDGLRGEGRGIREWVSWWEAGGFGALEAWAVAPDLDGCETLVPLTRDGDVAAVLRGYGMRKRWKLALLSTRMLRPFAVREIVLIARGGGKRPACLDGGGRALPVRRVYLSAAKASVWHGDGPCERIRDVSLDRHASFARLEELAAAWEGQDDAPAFFAECRVAGGDGRSWMERRAVQGTPLAALGEPVPEAALHAVCRRLRSFRAIGPQLAGPVLDRRGVVDHFLAANANARDRIDPSFAARLRAAADGITARFGVVPPILMHGDFTPNNVLLDAGAAEPIDWDLAAPVDFPGYDLLNLLLYPRCGPSPGDGTWERLVEECAAGRVEPELAAAIPRACGDVDPVGVAATFWLLRLARGAAFGSAWVERHALPSLARAETWLAASSIPPVPRR